MREFTNGLLTADAPPLAAALPLRASIPRLPLSVSRQADSGFAAVTFGLAWRADGLPSAASNGPASVSWSYDALGRATGEGSAVDGRLFMVANAYDASALATNTALSVGSWALSVQRSFDPAERLSSVTGGADGPSAVSLAFSYDAQDGGIASVSNAVFAEFQSRDLLGRVTGIVCRTASGGTAATFRYRYDASGLVTQTVSSVSGSAATNACAYDALGRLVSESITQSGTNALTRFSYDPAGNRLTAGTNAYAYSLNRLDGVLYDAAGNVTSMVSRAGVRLALTWNTLGQLVSVSTNGAFAESYAYDPLGRRVSTTDASGTTRHLYDGDQCAADTDASGNPLRVYTWGPGVDSLLAVTVYSSGATNSYYAVKDRLGSVRALVDSQGQFVQSYTYDAWGNPLSNSSTLELSNFPFLFHGGAYSAATGLYQFRARWYSPELGRWLSPDPIGLEGGLNLYEFCGNNPVNYRDPSGLWVGIDDLFFVGGGALLGMGGRLAGDLLTGNRSMWEDYVGAAVGGAAGGETLLYTANPILAGAAGGLAGNLSGQTFKNLSGKQCEYDVGSAAFDTAVGAVTGLFPGIPRLSGINAGRGSYLQVFRQMVMKASNGTINNMSTSTAAKMASGAFYEYAIGQGAAASALGSQFYEYITSQE
jgi:RHS repeat-associated protein